MLIDLMLRPALYGPLFVQTLVGQLPPVQQYLYRQAQTLRTGTTTEKLKAIATMGEGWYQVGTMHRARDGMLHTAI
jgi:hypothetical protein